MSDGAFLGVFINAPKIKCYLLVAFRLYSDLSQYFILGKNAFKYFYPLFLVVFESTKLVVKLCKTQAHICNLYDSYTCICSLNTFW